MSLQVSLKNVQVVERAESAVVSTYRRISGQPRCAPETLCFSIRSKRPERRANANLYRVTLGFDVAFDGERADRASKWLRI